MRTLMIGLLVVALIAAIVYFLMGAGILHPGNLQSEGAASSIVYVIGAFYVVGGLLILAKKRWLWIVGAILNALVIIIFYAMYSNRPDVLLSVPGLVTKIAQILLEIGLVYLIAKYRQKS